MSHLVYLLRLAAKSAWNRRFTLFLIVFSICLSTTLLLGIERMRVQVKEGFMDSVSGVDLIVGARGSNVQLVLYTVFRMGGATNNMGYDSAQRLAENPMVAWTIPVSLGDSHRHFPVLATNQNYFEHFRYGNAKALQFESGKPFTGVFDVVIGADVARALGYKVGSQIVLSHGSGGISMTDHTDKPFVVTGILEKTGTPVDRTLHIGLDGMEAIHLGWEGGTPVKGLNILPEHVKKFDLTPKSVTAVMVGLNKRAQVFALQREIMNDKQEALMGVLPGVALDELWTMLNVGEKALLAVSFLVALAGLAGLASSILAGLGERRRELAVLRSVGAKPHEIVLLLLSEGVLLLLSGMLAGVVCLNLALAATSSVIEKKWGLSLFPGFPGAGEWCLLGGIFVVGLMAALIPAIRAYRMSLSDGLTASV
ncbi:FtsX-like permease family protein [Oxalobacter vibrioformis]|uniref:FtsX-like permease family protein n=1 Tax=Oxalobacter vibrioformis TaxID=933080 RepID=A0A9E9P3F6_9BURK|nr:FtsX-like permease family protein [Oxalobacter vibrioformis]NLC23667.1 FtsX-like permease family protein [Oxalobacter sp.]WAW10170.1 FtsX-like permease family protein [Oxalobacter vibrioformis]